MVKFEEVTGPFEKGSGKQYVIMLHGYTFNPYELREFGDHLAREGFHVMAPLYPGHGEDKYSLAKHGKEDWIKEIEAVYSNIKAQDPENIFVTGQSMGGLLTLYLAIQHPEITAIAPIVAPVFLKKKILTFVPLVKRLFKFFPITEPADALDPNVVNDPIVKENERRYDKTVMTALVDLLSLMKIVNKDLDKIHQPALIIQAKKDKTVHPENAEYIFNHITTQEDQKKILMLENSGHMATMDYDKEKVFVEVSKFFKQFV
ncbi:MAG: alpha/beta hydrolase [Candidatus Hodarchaeales archaeon]